MAISPVRMLEVYLAMSLHMRGKYNYVKYNGQIKSATENALLKRKDKWIFERLAKKVANDKEAELYILANLVAEIGWLGKFSDGPFIQLKAYGASLDYKFVETTQFIHQKYSGYLKYIKENLETPTQDMLYYLSTLKMVSPQIFSLIEEKFESNLLWEDISGKVQLITPLLIRCWDLDTVRLKSLKQKWMKSLPT